MECARAGPTASAGARAGAALQRLEHLWPLIVAIPSTHCDDCQAASRTRKTASPIEIYGVAAVPQQTRHNECPGYGWASLSSQPLVLCAEAPLSCVPLLLFNCRLPSARVTGTPDGRSCGGLSSESKVAGNVEDGDEVENSHWPLGRFFD